MPLTVTNEDKNSALTVTNASKGSGSTITWDEADFTWDEGNFTWDNIGLPVRKSTKNSLTVTNASKN